ncbi:MAG: hypothetical protein HYT69_02995 [Candidatus Zambryskibacteria bacterium]|nr:hypothetical protein [Candidatus Zambryskibacteria bacterium]
MMIEYIRTMDKKALSITLIVLAVLAVVLVYNKNGKTPSIVSNKLIDGEIIEVKDDSIVVRGIAKSADGSRQEDRTVELEITNTTVLKKESVIFTIEQIKSQKPFTPTTENGMGDVSDLALKVRILEIVADKDLFTVDAARAVEIYYSIHVYPQTLQ